MQISIFDELYEEKKIKKKIRLIELFAGYGSQNLALKYLGANYEHYAICEWAVKSIQAYNDLHIRDYTDYAFGKTKEDLIENLLDYGISNDYNTPMTIEQMNRKNMEWLKQVYNNIIATNNYVNVQNVHGCDLDIVEKDKY